MQIQTDDKVMRQLHKLFGGKATNDEAAINRLNEQIMSGQVDAGSVDPCMADEENPSNPFMAAYRLTGMAKIGGVCDFIETLVENGAKFLVFAHHKCMIEGIEDFLCRKQFGYVRIDGRTPPDTRYAHVNRFQTDAKVRIALLSIMAAS